MATINAFKKLIFLILLSSISVASFAQTGILRGKITDAETGEELIGATVMIAGTTTGAASDLDGNYTVNNIEPGTYQFQCQFISYTPQTINTVEIKDGEVTIINFTLSSVSMGLQEVVISAKASQRSEASMLTIQKKSANVVDGISAQQMKRAGDSDAAGALKRVSGVNIEGGKYVFVRGLSDRYSKTTLNSAEIPGLDPNRNTVQMDIFPTNLIDNMVVYKSFTPNLPADFTGGLIDIITLDFPETFTMSFSVKAGYNTQASFNNEFLTYEGSSTDFMGYDDGLRDIPSAASGDIPIYPSDKQELTDITSSFNKIMSPSTQTSFMNSSYSFSIGNQHKQGNNSIGYIVGLSYKYDESFYDDGYYGEYTLVEAGAKQLTTQSEYKATLGQKESLWGALANISYKIGTAHKISANVFKNQSGISQARYMIGKKPSDDTENLFIETRKLLWMQRGFLSGQLRGEHYFENLSKLKVEWIGSVTKSKQEEPDVRYFINSYYPDNEGKYQYAIEQSLYQVPVRYYRDMDEINYNAKVNATINLRPNEQSAKLKFGGSYLYKDRNLDETRLDYKFQFPAITYNGNVEEFLSDQNIGLNYDGGYYGLYIQGNTGDDLINSYTADQTVYAGYAMIDVKIKDKIRIVTGLRVENAVINSASKDPDKPVGYLDDTDFLPALNLTYFLNEKMNLRLNGSRTLARPSFRELAPYASEDIEDGRTYVGNADLDRTMIDNYDFRYEYFMNPGEVASIGLFYKNFHDPIEVVDNPAAQNSELSWENMEQAQVFGMEVELRKKLDFVYLLRDFGFIMNFTYVYSEVSIDSLELLSIRATDPNASDTRQMSGQSPYIINAGLNYSNSDLGFEANAVYNVAGPKLIINVKGGTPDIYQQPVNSLNITASQRLSEKFSATFQAKNILNPVNKQTYTYEDVEYISRSYKKGVEFKVGVKYKF